MDKQWVEVELAPVVVAELAAVVAGLVPVVAALERVLVPAAAVAAEWAAAMRPHNHNRRAAGPLSLARLNKARRRAHYCDARTKRMAISQVPRSAWRRRVTRRAISLPANAGARERYLVAAEWNAQH